ncbi:MAG TPA: D-aminoacyl-tRNA deacylase, partial [Gaiella sp.]|nr:D-aminoacyl-tRNA deacylase [Gaiella sp.]
MRAVVQRVSRASVAVDGEVVGACGRGLLVLVGVGHDDTDATARRLAEKLARLRVFENDEGRFDR